MKLIEKIGLLFLIILITYGTFYYTYKFSNPNLGNNDYYNYRVMVEKPLDFNATQSPFIYRQFTTLISSAILKSGIYYKTKITYICNESEQKIYFSLLLTNYLGLIFTNLLIIYLSFYLYKIRSFFKIMFFVFLNITTFNYIFNGLAPLSEGWSYFFNLFLFYLYKRNLIIPFIIVICISIIQKEIISVFFSVLTILSLLINYINNKKIDFNILKFAMVSIFAFILYIILRKYILIINGNENQLNINAWINKLQNLCTSFDIQYFKQGFMTNGIIFIYILIYKISYKEFKINSDIIILLSSIFFIYIFGIFTSIGNNIGRIIASFTPILIITLFASFEDFLLYKNEED